MLCYSAISLLFLQVRGLSTSTLDAWEVHSQPHCKGVSITSQKACHSLLPTAAHFHDLAENQQLKRENHTCSPESSSFSEKPQLVVPIPTTLLENKRSAIWSFSWFALTTVIQWSAPLPKLCDGIELKILVHYLNVAAAAYMLGMKGW